MSNGIASIIIDGKTVGQKYGLPALTMLFEKAVERPEIFSKVVNEAGEVVDSFSEYGLAYLLYYGYINYCRLKELPEVHKFEFFMNYVEEVAYNNDTAGPISECLLIWGQSRAVKAFHEKQQEATKKKNGQQKT